MTETERNNLITTLNLEYGATQRYVLQRDRFIHPRAVALLEGVRRNEAEHIAATMSRIEAATTDGPEGFRTLYLHLKLDLAFEQQAVKLYGQFSKEAEDPELRETFRALLKSEAGHVRLFQELLKELEEGRFPKVFFCPLCGWEIDYGPDGKAGDSKKCDKCGATYVLGLENGDFTLAPS